MMMTMMMIGQLKKLHGNSHYNGYEKRLLFVLCEIVNIMRCMKS